jgi:hypothetical protein
MSAEERPNLHAVGLLCDIHRVLEGRLRGPAGRQQKDAIAFALPLIGEFCEELSDALDEQFGR